MGYLKIVSYVYLAIAAFLIYDGIRRIMINEEPYISFLLAAMAVFMFFFRKRYAEKIGNGRQSK